MENIGIISHKMKSLTTILLLFVCFAFSNPPGNEKKAYKFFFRGSISYSEGQFREASRSFQKAYNILPNNFHIALSLALSLSQSGHEKEAIRLWDKSAQLFSKKDPAYEQKMATLAFSGGLIHCFAQNYDRSFHLIKRSIYWQTKLGNTKLLSVLHNALAYVQFRNKSSNSNKGADIKRHLHIREDDMQRAMPLLEKALKYDPTNVTARNNLKLMTDTLGLKYPMLFDSTAMMQRRAEQAYVSLPQDVFESINFNQYDEIIFLLDISGSMVMENVVCMGKTRFEVMRETVLHLLNTIDINKSIGIGTIGGDCGTVPKLWIEAGSMSRSDLVWKIKFVNPDGTTPLLDILKASTELFSESDTMKRSIFLVSDGANICKSKGLDVCKWANNLSNNTTINILTFLDAQLNNANAFAEYGCLAQNTNGEIHYIDNYYCRLQAFSFNLVETFLPNFPAFERAYCFGKSGGKLWAIWE